MLIIKGPVGGEYHGKLQLHKWQAWDMCVCTHVCLCVCGCFSWKTSSLEDITSSPSAKYVEAKLSVFGFCSIEAICIILFWSLDINGREMEKRFSDFLYSEINLSQVIGNNDVRFRFPWEGEKRERETPLLLKETIFSISFSYFTSSHLSSLTLSLSLSPFE